jgi:AAA domain
MSHKFTSLHQHSTDVRDLIDGKFTDVQDALSKINSDLQRPLNRLTFQLNQMEDNLSKQQRLEVLLWLSKVAYRKHHVNMSADLLPGSCAWLERNSVFLDWSNASVSSVLWLHGIPGSGKSKLMAHMVQLFQNQAHSQLASAALAYFYCIRATAEPERADPDEIMRAILKQMVKTKVDQPLRRSILARFEKAQNEAMEDGSDPSPLTLDECVSLILEVLDDTSAIIIIDALDECDLSRRHELLRALKDIVAKANNLVKVFLSSRDHADIVLKLVDVPNIYINSTDNFDDIERFVTIKVDEAIQEQRLLGGKVSTGLRDDIISKLSENAQSM